MAEFVRIGVVDDHPLFRDGVVQTLRKTKIFSIVAVGHSAEDAVRIAACQQPEIMLLDINIPGGGLTAARVITKDPRIKVLVLTASEDEKDVFATIEAGARGFICKGVSSSELIRMIKAAHEGEFVISPSLASRLLTQQRHFASTDSLPKDMISKLTAREHSIMKLVSCGQTNKEIAKGLQLSEKTVKHYMTRIMRKLRVRNRVEAAINLRQVGDLPMGIALQSADHSISA